MRVQAFFAALMAVLMMSAPAAAATPGLNFADDRTPNPTITEDELVVGEHDAGEMDSPLEYYDDDGELAELSATYNMSRNTTVGVRFDKMVVSAYKQFPRVSGESGNAYNWTTAANWTKTSGASSSMSITEADDGDVDQLEIAGTVASTETATANFSQNVSVTTDVDKRVLTFVGSITNFAAGSNVTVRAVDSDGDYRYAQVNASANGSDADTIATGAADGVVFQEKLNNLPLVANGDGTMDEIQRIAVVVEDADATVVVSGLDVEKKTEFDLGEIRRDDDGDGDLEDVTVTNIWSDGKTNLTTLSSLGSTFDEAQIQDLSVYEVEYRLADISDEDEYMVEFSSADEYSYPEMVEVYADMEVPAAIDLSHGDLSLNFTQGLPGERYVTAEIAEDIDSDEEFGNLSDSDYANVASSINDQGEEHVLDGTVSSDSTYRVHMQILLQSEEVDDLQSSGMSGGPVGGSGGFLSTFWGQVTGLAAAVLGAIGLGRYVGGGA